MRNDRYLCGIRARARVTAGLGLWQRAFGSAADLTEADCAKARVARTGGVRAPPKSWSAVTIRPPAKSAARHRLDTETGGGGGDLPIDHDPRIDPPAARLNGPLPAAGWIKDLARDTTDHARRPPAPGRDHAGRPSAPGRRNRDGGDDPPQGRPPCVVARHPRPRRPDHAPERRGAGAQTRPRLRSLAREAPPMDPQSRRPGATASGPASGPTQGSGIRGPTSGPAQGPGIRGPASGPAPGPGIKPGTGARHTRRRAIQGARSGRPGSATRRDRCRIPRCPANRPGAKGPAGLRPPGGRQRHRRPAPRPAPPCLAMPRPAPGEAAQADRNTRLATLAIRMRKPGLPAPCVTVLPRPPARPGKALCPAAGLAALITRSPARRGASPRARGVRCSASDRRATRAVPEPPGQRPTPLPHRDPPEA